MDSIVFFGKRRAMELAYLQQWIGRTERCVDRVDAARVVQLGATLDREDVHARNGDELPPLWHWMFFTPVAPASQLSPDGHPKRGGFLPPVALPRRMWAGGRLAFERPLRVGDDLVRESRILDVQGKQGRSGSLVFITVGHEISDARGAAIREEYDIVYRDEPRPQPTARDASPTGADARTDEDFSRRIVPDSVLLFRYSAVTFNGHRIHYDRSYVTDVEGYPGLVVHGPLIATLLLDLLRGERPAARVAHFSFKARRPLFDLHPFDVCGRANGECTFDLWARDYEGRLAMQASAEIHQG